MNKLNRKISSLKDDMWDALKAFERKIAEFDATFACIPDGAFIINNEGSVIAINDTALNILGIQRSEIHLIPFTSWIETFKIHGPDGKPLSQKVLQLDNKIISFDKVSGYTLRIVNKKGRKKILSLSASPIYDDHNKSATGTVVIFSDITLQETLNSILQVTVKAETMRDLLTESANIISNNFSISMLGIYLYDEDTGTLRIRASKGLKKDVLKVVGIQYVSEGSPGVSSAAIRDRKTIIAEGAADVTAKMGYGDINQRLGVKSVIGIPLLVGNTVQGSITLLQVADKELSGEEIHILETVCGQLAMSISKIRGAEDERIFREVLSRRTAELNAIISQMIDGVLVVDA
ncbi:MAG TPA: PAS domain-containing protein, partial [Methanocellaceae archaeon]